MIRNEYKEILKKTSVGIGVLNSDIIDVSIIDKFSIQAMWENLGSLLGTITVHGSNNREVFSEILESSLEITSTDSYMFNFPDVCFRYVRVELVVSSGSCNIEININTKGGVS